MSPRPRFERLDSEVRERILSAAAAEFAQNGFDGASFNRIIEQSGVSKGAMYYYFDDKADLFGTTLLWATEHFSTVWTPAGAEGVGPDGFWDHLTTLYRDVVFYAEDHPSLIGVIKVAMSDPTASEALSRGRREYEALGERWVREIIHLGQAEGAIRSDLPQDLLLHVVLAVGMALDKWLLSKWDEMVPDRLDEMTALTMGLLRQVAAPVKGEGA